MKRGAELTALQVKNLPSDNRLHNVGGVLGLYVKKNASGAGSWILRYTSPEKKRRDFGLGSYKELTLKEAREKAAAALKAIEQGIDPIEARKADIAQAEQNERLGLTFARVAGMWFDDSEEERERINRGWRRREEARLKKNVLPVLGLIPIAQLSEMDVLRCLGPLLQAGKKATFEKLRPMVRQIASWAILKGYRENRLNPAGGALTDLLGTVNAPKAETENHPACAVEEVPRLMRELLLSQAASAKALVFCILTAGRSQAVRLTAPEDIDYEAAVWTVRRENDKVKDKRALREVMLSSYALDFLKTLPRIEGAPYLFTSPNGGALTPEALAQRLKSMHKTRKAADGVGWIDPVQTKLYGKDRVITPHGMRAAFRTWAEDDAHGNNRRFDPKAVEQCMLHKTDDKYDGAYSRGTYPAERRRIMEAWGRYCMDGKWPDDEN